MMSRAGGARRPAVWCDGMSVAVTYIVSRHRLCSTTLAAPAVRSLPRSMRTRASLWPSCRCWTPLLYGHARSQSQDQNRPLTWACSEGLETPTFIRRNLHATPASGSLGHLGHCLLDDAAAASRAFWLIISARCTATAPVTLRIYSHVLREHTRRVGDVFAQAIDQAIKAPVSKSVSKPRRRK